ncbi:MULTISPECIES: CCE_0567 family metalloprotein [unclassified Lebetimonas]|jgi:hypothetical protein|uniref:CCE_0567 family metalloprotein n=1 Tax=unclassified Lebetimonas TaxID=2648158 RepID=UPI000464D195|nr:MULTISPECIES: CCE_0567 family metalloprotein [unclassified Lebetimonas]
MDKKELKKELGKRKRKAVELAGQIHDIVEDTLWVDYNKLPELSKKIVEAVEEVERFKKETGL